MAADHSICIITLGERGVGKTSLLVRFSKNYFAATSKTTVGIDKYIKTIILNNKRIKIVLWDTAGQEKHKAIFKKYFRDADGVLLVYDMTNHATFMELPSWLHDLRALNQEAPAFIVGNKADLRHLNQVSGATVEKYAREEGLDFYETSAMMNENVDEVFEKLALNVLETKKIAPFYKEIPNGEIEPEGSINPNSDSSEQQIEIILPPIIRLTDNKEMTIDEIKAGRSRSTVSMSTQTEDNSIISLSDDSKSIPKQKKKGCC